MRVTFPNMASLLPRICFCPVDQRPIYGVPGSIPMKPNGKPYRLK